VLTCGGAAAADAWLLLCHRPHPSIPALDAIFWLRF
jgi:hypothetical protein